MTWDWRAKTIHKQARSAIRIERKKNRKKRNCYPWKYSSRKCQSDQQVEKWNVVLNDTLILRYQKSKKNNVTSETWTETVTKATDTDERSSHSKKSEKNVTRETWTETATNGSQIIHMVQRLRPKCTLSKKSEKTSQGKLGQKQWPMGH